MIQDSRATWFLRLLVLLLFFGCNRSEEPADLATGPVAPTRASSATMKLVIVTEIYDSKGEHQDQKIEMLDALPEVLIDRFNAIDWNHSTNRYALAISGGEMNSANWKKLGISEDLPEGSEQTILAARLTETPPDGSSETFYTFEPIESPDVALKLLVSFLAQDGNYRTMVDWQE